MADLFAPLQLDLPPRSHLVKTTGQEEGYAAYTRRTDTVVLPANMIASVSTAVSYGDPLHPGDPRLTSAEVSKCCRTVFAASQCANVAAEAGKARGRGRSPKGTRMSSSPQGPDCSIPAPTSDALFVMQLNRRVEEERRRLVGELHDVIGAALVSARLKASTIEGQASDSSVPRDEVAQLAGDLVSELGDIYAATRGLIHKLRSETLDVCGLSPALEELVRSYTDSSTNCTFSFGQERGMPKISGELATQGYRLVQEALTNVVKHSSATYVSVFARCVDGQLQLSVRDDGIGFDVHRHSPGIGLPNMRERVTSIGGRMDVRSSGEEGTALTFTLPMGTLG